MVRDKAAGEIYLLLLAEGRHEGVAAEFVKKDGARLLMRTLAPLTDAEIAQVQRVAQRLARQHAKEAK